jgi:hypothetical protein
LPISDFGERLSQSAIGNRQLAMHLVGAEGLEPPTSSL